MEKFKITIPKPCHENWNAMTPDEQGRFCGVCAKSVIDFTEMNDVQVKTFFSENAGKKICGRFRDEQVNGGLVLKIPQSVIYKKRKFRKAFLLALFVVMGTTLFSCKNEKNQPLEKISIETSEPTTTTGAPRTTHLFEDSEKDTNKVKESSVSLKSKNKVKKNNPPVVVESYITKGDIIYVPLDTIKKDTINIKK